ncbi:bifunctional diguanylate cyclase/phosphodiesterase [Acidithiobacillus sp.]
MLMKNIGAPRGRKDRYLLWAVGAAFLLLAVAFLVLWQQLAMQNRQDIHRHFREAAIIAAQQLGTGISQTLGQRFANLRFLKNQFFPTAAATLDLGPATRSALRAFDAAHPQVLAINILDATGTRLLWSTVTQPSRPMAMPEAFTPLPLRPDEFIGPAHYARRFHAWVITMRVRMQSRRGETLGFIGSPLLLSTFALFHTPKDIDAILLNRQNGQATAVWHAGRWAPPTTTLPPPAGSAELTVPDMPWVLRTQWTAAAEKTAFWAQQRKRLLLLAGLLMVDALAAGIFLTLLSHLLRLRRYQEAALLAQQEMLRSTEPIDLFHRLTAIIVSQTDCIAAYVVVPDEHGDALKIAAVAARNAARRDAIERLVPSRDPQHYPYGQMLVSRAFREGIPIGPLPPHPDIINNNADLKGLAVVVAWPIRIAGDGEPVAVLAVELLSRRHFTLRLQQLMRLLADNIGTFLYQQQLYRQVQDLVIHDTLTGLPNRSHFKQSVSTAITQARDNGRHLAIGLLDLDGFKEVNDTQGHGVGDAILQAVALRLQDSCQGSLMMARMGGDEFACCLPWQAGDDLDIDTVSQKALLAVVSSAATVTDMPVSGSLGWALFPDDGPDFKTLLAHADEAMYAAKAAGKSTYRSYGGAVAAAAERRIQVHQDFLLAIAQGDIAFFLQPQADVVAGHIDGAEMLVRWRQQDGRWRNPGKFMPIVEQDHRLIRALGIHALRETVRLRERCRSEGLHIRLSLNIGALHFLHPDFLEDVASHCPEGEGLTIEITESIALADLRHAQQVAMVLKDRGFHLSLDDFGTGYSSMLYTTQLPFDELKLDQNFVFRFRRDNASFAVAGAARLLGDLSGRSMIAEGIANPADLTLWLRMGGRRIQGYHLAPPLPENAFFTWYQYLQPVLRRSVATLLLEDLPLLSHMTEDASRREGLSMLPAAGCPMSKWFCLRRGEYQQIPAFLPAERMHQRLHALGNGTDEKALRSALAEMRTLSLALYTAIAQQPANPAKSLRDRLS